jgi:hypothetical protein
MWQDSQAASYDTFSNFSASTLLLSPSAVLDGCFAVVSEMEPHTVVSEMEPHTEHSMRFKQCAMIEFLTAEGVFPIEIH